MMKRLVRWSCYIPRNGLEKYPNGVLDLEGIGNRPCLGALQERTYLSGPKISEKVGVGKPAVGFSERPVLGGNGFDQMVRRKHSLSRDWFAKLWVADKKDDRMKEKGEQRGVSNWSPFFRTSMFNARFREQKVQETDADVRSPAEYDEHGALEEPPGSQYVPPTSTEEVKLAPLLSRSDLLITRDIEWANLMFAFEQESRYKIVDPCYPDFAVGSIHEQSNLVYRQLLRTRRPFIAYITDAHGDEIFRIRRPFWWINSTIYAEVDGKEIGVVHRRWHLWRRIYDLYLGKRQFAIVENPGFWNWTFTLKDNEEKVLAEINRDWRGFGFELFTDAGQYVIRFGPANSGSIASQAANFPELDIGRSLSLSERAVAVALAVSLDCDYFSRHSGRGMPFFIIDE